MFTFSVSSRGLSSTNALARFVKLVGRPSEMKIILGCTQKAPILWMRSNIEYFTFPLRVRLMCAIINKFQFNINIDQFRRSINHWITCNRDKQGLIEKPDIHGKFEEDTYLLHILHMQGTGKMLLLKGTILQTQLHLNYISLFIELS